MMRSAVGAGGGASPTPRWRSRMSSWLKLPSLLALDCWQEAEQPLSVITRMMSVEPQSANQDICDQTRLLHCLQKYLLVLGRGRLNACWKFNRDGEPTILMSQQERQICEFQLMVSELVAERYNIN